MKKLIINNKLTTIYEDQYFPFTYKLNDPENIDLINFQVSKTIELPKNDVNDEIFGYSFEFTREDFGFTDSKIGISFNQVKKCPYTLMDGNIVVSEGIIQIENITNDKYMVKLLDKSIDIIQQLDGNEETGDGYLSSLDLYDSNDNIYTFKNYAQNIPNIIDKTIIVPTIVKNDEDNLKSTDIRLFDLSTGDIVNHTLPEDMTQLQSRSIKSSNINYAVTINNVIKSINNQYNDIINVDSSLTDFFDELHLDCGSPKINLFNKNNLDNTVIKSYTFPNTIFTKGTYNGLTFDQYITTTGNQYIIPLKDINDVHFDKVNGKYYMEVPIELDFRHSDIIPPVLGHISYWNGNNILDSLTNTGDKLGEINISTELGLYDTTKTDNRIYYGNYGINKPEGYNKKYNGVVKILSNKIKNTLELYKNVSCWYIPNAGGNKRSIQTKHTLVLSYDFNPLLDERYLNDQLCLIINLDDLLSDFNTSTFRFFNNQIDWDIYFTIKIGNGGKIKIDTNEKFKSGDNISGHNIYPKIPIKDFIINLCKQFNLRIENIDGKLKINRKFYNEVKTPLILTNINSIDKQHLNYNRVILTNEQTSNSIISTDYVKLTEQKYGQKRVFTGNNINKEVKKIEFQNGVPALMKDTSKIAYDSFLKYFNSGKSRDGFGVNQGLTNKITFCFLNDVINTPICLTNDSYYENNILVDSEPYIFIDGLKELKENRLLQYNSGNDEYKITNNTYPDYVPVEVLLGHPVRFDKNCIQSVYYSSYKTISPYIFNQDGYITKSLDINKSKYNYAGIQDINYPENSTIYNSYFKKQLEDYWNSNTIIVDCNILFQEGIELYGIYNYKNTHFIIKELPEYDPTNLNNIISGVKLLKVNNKYNYINGYLNPDTLEFDAEPDGFDTISFNITCDNQSEFNIAKIGVCYSTTNLNPTINDNVVFIENELTYTDNITGLSELTTYYLRGYIIDEIGKVTYSNKMTITTGEEPSLPQIEWSGEPNIYSDKFDFGLNITKFGGTIIEKGVCSSFSPNPVYTSYPDYYTGTDNPWIMTVTGVTPETTYYFRGFVRNETGVAYTSNLQIRSYSDGLPNFSIYNPTNITKNGCDIYCKFLYLDEDFDIVDRGFQVYTSPPGYSDGSPVATFNINGNIREDFYHTFTNLNPNTLYYIRAYITITDGDFNVRSYCPAKTFNTLVDNPIVSLPNVYRYDYDYYTLYVESEFTNLTLETFSEKGFSWTSNINISPDLYNGTVVTSYDFDGGNLIMDTTLGEYYQPNSIRVRCYVKNTNGEYFWSDVSTDELLNGE